MRKVDSSEPENAAKEGTPSEVSSRIPRRRHLARTQPADIEQPPELEITANSMSPLVDLAAPEPAPVRPLQMAEPRILVVHDAAATFRLIEETFENFTKARVDSTPDVLTAFEMAIRRDYQLFIIAMTLPEMSGSLFYEFVARAYATGLNIKKIAPAVVFIREKNSPQPPEDLIRDVRVKAIWTKPLNIERMLESVSSIIKRT